ncbi:FKBP-type peptidyl-prolyl cis-trans isomerase [Phenylobacterium sp. LjRoot219]|uniref:FKBP-type peptidyl-prolyl cis-trans isomerase n=1 Tax=Phenylobacterium sp. LjRoot219 TaxID=3342283 RepID=UPI003ECE3D01
MIRKLIICAVAALALAGCHKNLPDQSGAAQVFLAQNAKQAGVQTLPSGLQYKVVRSGPADGIKPRLGDEVKVHYEGKLIDGTVFDSSYERGQPAAMPLNGLIKGWQEALQLMRPGDEWILYVPPNLGYGAEGAGGTIPPGAALVFRIELIGVLPGEGRVQQG